MIGESTQEFVDVVSIVIVGVVPPVILFVLCNLIVSFRLRFILPVSNIITSVFPSSQ